MLINDYDIALCFETELNHDFLLAFVVARFLSWSCILGHFRGRKFLGGEVRWNRVGKAVK